MDRIAVFVGLDYHSNPVQVCVMDGQGVVLGNHPCGNDWRQIVGYAEERGQVVRAALEASTGAAHLAEELADRAGWSVDLAHPGYVSRMKQNPDKTDFSDARMLADLERVGYLPRVWMAPVEIRELRRLVRYRQQLADQRRNTKLRMQALLRDHRLRCPLFRPWTQGWEVWLASTPELSGHSRWLMDEHREELNQLKAKIGRVETRLEQATHADPLVQALMKQPGIGPVTAWTIRAEIGRFDRFRSGKQLSRFCGLSPRNASSGQRQADAGLIRAGNPRLRAVLIEAGHRLQRQDRHWAELSDRMKQHGKPGSVVAAAVANRWMRWLFHQMQPQRPVVRKVG